MSLIGASIMLAPFKSIQGEWMKGRKVMLEIDLEKARELLKAAVAERGEDYVYSNPHVDPENPGYRKSEYSGTSGYDGPSCLYVHKDMGGNITPGCGVGLALILGGVPAEYFDKNNDGTIEEKSTEMRNDKVVDLSPDAADYLRAFQQKQDSEVAWGEALRIAEGSLSK